MRVLFFGRFDWANISHRVARAINTSGLGEARVLVERAHPLGYQEDMVVEKRTHRDFRQWVYSADWIVSTGDANYDYFMSMIALLSPRARLAICHVGTAYRDAHEHLNEVDAKIGFDRRFIGGDLYRFALGDPKAVPYFAPPHDIVGGQGLIAVASPPAGQRIRIGHSPSSREAKGTLAVIGALAGLDADVDIIEGVSIDECLRRRARCDIFVDQLHPEIGGFGASAVEAMAAGCAVLADTHNVSTYVDKFYPPPPILSVRTSDELRARLEHLIADRRALDVARARSLGWVHDNASAEVIARYWLGHLA